MKSKRVTKKLFLAILILGISIGFAYVSTTLRINGSASIGVHDWNIHWDTIANEDGVTPNEAPKISNEVVNNKTLSKVIVTWDVQLNEPGDYYEFTVDAVNEGSLAGMVSDITNTASPTLPSYVKYTVTYADGNPIRKYHKLLKAKTVNNELVPSTETYKIRVEYDMKAVEVSDINDMPDIGESYSFTFAVTYQCANRYAYDRKYSDLQFSDKLGNNGTPPAYIGLATVTQYADLTGAFTDDYTTLVDANNQQKERFSGVKINSAGIIEKGYACGVINNELLCIEGPSNEKTYDFITTVLPTIFGEYDQTTGTGCRTYEGNNPSMQCYIEKGNTNAYIMGWKDYSGVLFYKDSSRYSIVYPSGPPGATGYAITQ